MLNRAILAVCAATALQAVEIAPIARLQDGDRVVFVGDSITGQSVNNGPTGFVGVIRRALDTARPENRIELTALGGSGQGVGSWLTIERKSRDAETILDVPKVDARATLQPPVGVLVVMLGMNDSLSPYIGTADADIEAWAAQYRTLVTALRGRTQARVLALGTVTPNTEEAESPKNRLLARMNARLKLLAGELDAVVLPTGEAVRELLQEGRTCRPDYHVTSDYVHPDRGGHAAIAYGMLAGLGERAAAEEVRHGTIDALLAQSCGPLPALSYTLQPTAAVGTDASEIALAWHWTAAAGAAAQPDADLEVPAGWKTTPGKGHGFIASGPLDHLVNRLKLRVGDGTTVREHDIAIPAPWLIGHGFANPEVWEHGTWKYQPGKGGLPGEGAIMHGTIPTGLPAGWQAGALAWTRWIPSLDHTGGATPGNINVFGVDMGGSMAAAFAARWIRSDGERTVRIVVGSAVFAGPVAVEVCLRGEAVYSGVITDEPKRRVEREVVLRPGWNALVCKINHIRWQEQCSVGLEGDRVDELIVSTVPKP